MRRASAGAKASYSAPGLWIDKLSCTTRMQVGAGIMDIDEFTHAVGVVHGGAAVGDLDFAPAPMRIEMTKRLTVPLRRYS